MKVCAICGHVSEKAVCSICLEDARRASVFELVTEALGDVRIPKGTWNTWLCPFHGDHNDGNFYVNKPGNFWKCFTCGKGGDSIAWLMEYNGLSFIDAVKHLSNGGVLPTSKPKKVDAKQQQQARRRPAWLEHAARYIELWAKDASQVEEAWRAYVPTIPTEIIEKRRYGFGRLPNYSSHCDQMRLIVPLTAGETVFGVRARVLPETQTACPYRDGKKCTRLPGRNDKCAKWLSPSMPKMPLYNGARLLPAHLRADHSARGLLCDCLDDRDARGAIVHIIENPVDADLFEYKFRDGVDGVQMLAIATLGVTMWSDTWTKTLKWIQPDRAVVMYDNDVAGNGNTPQAWAVYEGRDGVIPNGVRLVNSIIEAGVPAHLFDWGKSEAKSDIGDFLR